MSRLWSWLRRCRAAGRPTAAPPRPPRPSARPRVRVRFDTLEDRLAPSATSLHDAWRSETFQVDAAVVSDFNGPTFQAAGTGFANQSFGSLVGLDEVYHSASAPRGKGQAVAVIDTGIDYRHPDLGGGWGKRVVAGWDFANNDSDPMDDNGHGTHVAGIIGSSSVLYAGVAPEVNLVALKVLSKDGAGSFGAVEDALQWVIANRAKYNIASINLSLGSGNSNSNPYQFLEDEFATLKSQGVFIAVASGNSFYSYQSQAGLAYPAVSPKVVSVGAVWTGDFGPVAWASGARDNTTAADRVTSFTQRNANLSILAPGAMITSTYLSGKYQSMAGTSMASPVVAGAAVLVKQALVAAGKAAQANQDGILALMKSTGVRVVDGDDENDNVTNTGLAFRRLDVAAALRAAGTPISQPPAPRNSAPVVAAVADQTVVPGGVVSVGITASDPDGDAITLSARIVGQEDAGAALAHQFKQSLGLYHLGGFFTNAFGMQEKWIGGAGGLFFTLLPNGELRRWTGSAASTLLAANLVGSLPTSYYVDPLKLINAEPAGPSPVTAELVGNQVTIRAAAGATGSYQVQVTASDGSLSSSRTFTVSIAAIDAAPIWTPIADRSVGRNQTLTVDLDARDPDGRAIAYSARALDRGDVVLALVGSRLTITPPRGFSGSFTIEATASNGLRLASTTFRVTTGNAPPTLSIAAGVAAPRGATTVGTPLAAFDRDGDPVTLSATVASAGSSTLYQLKSSLGLEFSGSYFTNAYGLGEKWLRGGGGLDFYCILPSGELRKFTGSVADLSAASTLIARLDSSIYADPSRLWNASASAPIATARIVDNQLIVTLNEPFRGSIAIDVAASDGLASTTKRVVFTFS